MLSPKSSVLCALALIAVSAVQISAQRCPLTFMDMQHLNRGGEWTPSPDGAWMLYTISTRDRQRLSPTGPFDFYDEVITK